MNLQYTGEETVTAGKAKVWAFITDPAKVGGCLPDVVDVDGARPDPLRRDRPGRRRARARQVQDRVRADARPDRAAGMDMKMSGGGLWQRRGPDRGRRRRRAGDGYDAAQVERRGRGPRPGGGGGRARARRAGAEAHRADVCQRPASAVGVRWRDAGDGPGPTLRSGCSRWPRPLRSIGCSATSSGARLQGGDERQDLRRLAASCRRRSSRGWTSPSASSGCRRAAPPAIT